MGSSRAAFIINYLSSRIPLVERANRFYEPRTIGTRGKKGSVIFEYIETFYNRTRLYSSLTYHSPLNFELQLN